MTDEIGISEAGPAWISGARLAIGLAQGVALYLLYRAIDSGSWPATNGLIFAPLLFVALYVPPLKLVSLGNMWISVATVWLIAAALAVAGCGWYDIWHDNATGFWANRGGHFAYGPKVAPSFGAFFFVGVAAFIAQALVASGDADRKFVAHYETYFDVTWKLAVQWALAVFFTSVFWLLLWLGAELFDLIGIDFFEKLIEHSWFAIPITALAIAVSVHLTDVRASLVRGARTLLLVLLSWLLPVMTLIAAGFLLGLVFTGLAPLWSTRWAAGYLLIAAGVLIVLINAAFQDGHEERRPPSAIRYTASLASALLLPFVAIAAYAIMLRVWQYGWTTERVGAIASAIVAGCYAIGYAVSAFVPGRWLAPMARWNFVTSLVVLVVITALYSPVADPMRISVASQVARLESGKIDPNKFDFAYLHWQGGRFGEAALERLAGEKAGANAATIRHLAKAELARKHQYEVVPPKPLDLVANITVYPRGRTLPKNFVARDWNKFDGSLPSCMRSVDYKCDAYIFDFAGDGHEEIAVIGESPYGGGYPYGNALFAEAPDGNWVLVGRPDPSWACPDQVKALNSGNAQVVAPEPPRWREVAAGDKRLTILTLNTEGERCPK